MKARVADHLLIDDANLGERLAAAAVTGAAHRRHGSPPRRRHPGNGHGPRPAGGPRARAAGTEPAGSPS